MKLIDADKLYDWVRRECNPYGKPTIDFESGNRMLDMIKRSSTEFDKEKVIEELKCECDNRLKNWEENLFWNENRKEEGVIKGLSMAITIVEKGGIE